MKRVWNPKNVFSKAGEGIEWENITLFGIRFKMKERKGLNFILPKYP